METHKVLKYKDRDWLWYDRGNSQTLMSPENEFYKRTKHTYSLNPYEEVTLSEKDRMRMAYRKIESILNPRPSAEDLGKRHREECDKLLAKENEQIRDMLRKHGPSAGGFYFRRSDPKTIYKISGIYIDDKAPYVFITGSIYRSLDSYLKNEKGKNRMIVSIQNKREASKEFIKNKFIECKGAEFDIIRFMDM